MIWHWNLDRISWKMWKRWSTDGVTQPSDLPNCILLVFSILHISFVRCPIDLKLCRNILWYLRMIPPILVIFGNLLGGPYGLIKSKLIALLTAPIVLNCGTLTCRYLLYFVSKWLEIFWSFSLIYRDHLWQVSWILERSRWGQTSSIICCLDTYLTTPFALIWSILFRQ